ncbi:MAG: phenylacetate--CoA ligase [Clostridia bacterium]|nr:phenylacetate--CoA ligase [Clostridia bacterium]MBN2883292.1 phenylacetate--CoA ligase [Clostridia bacterium]
MTIWNPKYECMGDEEKRILQGIRLAETVSHVYENVPFYKKKMDSIGILPGDIKCIDNLKDLPFTYKTDLREHYPYGLFAVPMDDVVRIHASSGTTGKRTVVGYTREDIDVWAEVMARTISACGATKSDILQNAYGYGLFTGGLGVHYGAEKIGMSVIPISGGNTKRQIELMLDFGSTIISCTPSYALYLAEVIEEQKIDRSKIKLRAGIFGAEPWSENMRRDIEERLGVLAIDIYGLSEIIGPGVSQECPEKCGLHVNDDHFIPEIIDPDTEKVLDYGEQGEIVFTTVTKKALPLLRYRTRDISKLDNQPCACGRTSYRMEKVTGRTDDMLIIRGVNVFPTQIESVLLELGETAPHYQLIVSKMGSMDALEVQVEMTQALFSDEVKKIEDLERKLKFNIESTLAISAKVTLVEPKTIARSEGKAQRVIDNRNL